MNYYYYLIMPISGFSARFLDLLAACDASLRRRFSFLPVFQADGGIEVAFPGFTVRAGGRRSECLQD